MRQRCPCAPYARALPGETFASSSCVPLHSPSRLRALLVAFALDELALETRTQFARAGRPLAFAAHSRPLAQNEVFGARVKSHRSCSSFSVMRANASRASEDCEPYRYS